jgi:tetratricopeptide (TPR) repeat protein
MAADAVAGGARYWAFISYSHKDAAFGRRLHRRLERYALPRRLVGRATASGSVPKRLTPIFRDREELSAAGNLSAEVRAALQASASLIVVCSPAAKESEWVTREVELFRELHPDRPVFAAILHGEPRACMPAALRQTGPGGDIIEPLAADFRRGGDGLQLGVLKLVAGIVGIGLDELIQRESRRQWQRVTAITVSAAIAVLLMGALTLLALNARAEAERQRGEAEGLVEFMLTDLRDRLKGVGRLDVLTAVNERALHYYSDEDIDSLPAASLERRARILHAMGEDDEVRGNYDAALAKFEEAKRTTAALLAASPNDPERIFMHAQTDFWIGSVDFERDRPAAALPYLQAYRQLSERLVQMAPDNPKYIREVADADGDLCAIALEPPRNLRAAIPYCQNQLVELEKAAQHLGPASGINDDLINAHAWMADCYYYSGDYRRAESERLQEEKILDGRIAADPKNTALKDLRIIAERALALIEKQAGDKAAARARLVRALAAVESLRKIDPKNNDWNEDRDKINRDLSALH